LSWVFPKKGGRSGNRKKKSLGTGHKKIRGKLKKRKGNGLSGKEKGSLRGNKLGGKQEKFRKREKKKK